MKDVKADDKLNKTHIKVTPNKLPMSFFEILWYSLLGSFSASIIGFDVGNGMFIFITCLSIIFVVPYFAGKFLQGHVERYMVKNIDKLIEQVEGKESFYLFDRRYDLEWLYEGDSETEGE